MRKGRIGREEEEHVTCRRRMMGCEHLGEEVDVFECLSLERGRGIFRLYMLEQFPEEQLWRDTESEQLILPATPSHSPMWGSSR